MTEELDYKFIKNVLEKNNNKNFVKRILKKDDYGVLKNPDGTHSTHSMAYGSVGDMWYYFKTTKLF